MCDRYNPGWQVTVDGKPDQILRCNFLERGVFLQPGKHEVEFSFAGSYTAFAVSLGAAVVGLLICGCLAMTREPEPTTPASQAPRTASGTPARAESGADASKKNPKKG
jgi:uncharacterized membrane protein YfhO